jgi:hypothetical protein
MSMGVEWVGGIGVSISWISPEIGIVPPFAQLICRLPGRLVEAAHSALFLSLRHK